MFIHSQGPVGMIQNSNNISNIKMKVHGIHIVFGIYACFGV